jgi:hypothetical protein
MREDWNTHMCVCLQVLWGKRNMWRATQGWPADEFFWLLKKGDFILHLPFWNSFSWEVNSFPELQNIKESEAVYCCWEQILIFEPCVRKEKIRPSNVNMISEIANKTKELSPLMRTGLSDYFMASSCPELPPVPRQFVQRFHALKSAITPDTVLMGFPARLGLMSWWMRYYANHRLEPFLDTFLN